MHSAVKPLENGFHGFFTFFIEKKLDEQELSLTLAFVYQASGSK